MADQSGRPMEIDRAIELFLDCQARHGLPTPSEPITDQDLAAVAKAVAPMRLPDEIVTLWRRFQQEDGALADGYELTPAKYGLRIWQQDVDAGGTWPLCLFPIACESHSFVWIELHGPSDLDGGAIWKGNYEFDDITSVSPSLAGLVLAVAEGWDQGLFGRHFHSFVEDDQKWAELLHERVGPSRSVGLADRHAWPDRWKRLSKLEEPPPFPAGRVVPIGQLRSSPAWRGSSPATIEGEVDGVMGMGAGCLVVIDDGTGRLEVWVPAKTDRFADVRRGAAVQLQVVRSGGTPKEPDVRHAHAAISDALLRGDMAAAQSIAIKAFKGFDPTKAEAVATSVRRARR